MDYSKLFDWIKLKPVHYLGVVMASGVLLFASNWGLQRLGLAGFIDKYRAWIGLLFVASSCGLIAHGLVKAAAVVKRSTEGYFFNRHLAEKLKRLSPKEKEILR